MRVIAGGVVVAIMLGGAACADGFPEPIDIASLDQPATSPAPTGSVWDDVPIEPVSRGEATGRRFYVTGLLGGSFVTLADSLFEQLPGGGSIEQSVLTWGGAAGIAVERAQGQLRIEVEGRGRDDVTAHYGRTLGPGAALDFGWAANDGWSALVNAWRDFNVSEQVDMYLGGGIGGGGYRYGFQGLFVTPSVTAIFDGSSQVASFAWQCGGGLVWNVNERTAFDIGYRFFSIDQAQENVTINVNGTPSGSALFPQQYTAGELLFGLRIYEPFRRWR
ncbi:MAG: hypothetical protein ACKOC8_10695 [Pirellulales bacterium]